MPAPEFREWWVRFNTTGDICPIHLGMSRDEVRAVLGEPDDKGGTSRKYPTPSIWKYDELEFHFGPRASDKLFLIYLEEDQVTRISISSLLT